MLTSLRHNQNQNGLQGSIKPSQIDCYSVYWIICQKYVNVPHQGFKDIDRHCEGHNHVDKLCSIRSQQPIQKFFVKKNSETDHLVSLAEVRFARFLAEHNLPFTAADHLKSLMSFIS